MAVRFGLIGCGFIGRYHAQAAADSSAIDLVAVADLRHETARDVARQHGVPNAYADAESLIADESIDAVVLAMPAHIRTALALKVFAAGKHLLTEKPVAMNSQEVETMIAARGDLVAACCCSRYQFLKATSAVTECVASGALGPLRLVRCRAARAAGPPPQHPPPPWRLSRSLNGGGIMSNWGCYDLDYLFGITGWSLQPQTVLAQTWSVPPAFADYAAPESDAETHVTALIRCQDGIAISYERAEMVAAQNELAWELIGDNGSLRLQMTPAEDGRMTHFSADATTGTASTTLCAADEDHAKVHAGPINDLAAAIRDGRPPQTSLERALVIQRITDAIYASADRGVAVAVS